MRTNKHSKIGLVVAGELLGFTKTNWNNTTFLYYIEVGIQSLELYWSLFVGLTKKIKKSRRLSGKVL